MYLCNPVHVSAAANALQCSRYVATWCRVLQYIAVCAVCAQYTALWQKIIYKDKASFSSLPPCMCMCSCGVTTISRLLKIIGLLGKRALKKKLYCAKETYNFKEPTHRSHSIPTLCGVHVMNTLQHIETQFNAMQHTKTHCNTLQHIAT